MGLDNNTPQYSQIPLSEGGSSVVPVVPHSAVDIENNLTHNPYAVSSATVITPDNDQLGTYCQWGQNSCFTCEPSPCCGSPCNLSDGAYCCFNWALCYPCSAGKLVASSAGLDECAIVNHCLPFYLFGILDRFIPCSGSLLAAGYNANTRRNLRIRQNVGQSDITVGDFLMHFLPCTHFCALCQEIRSVPVESWDWISQVSQKGIKLVHDGSIVSAYVPSYNTIPPAPMGMSVDAPPPTTTTTTSGGVAPPQQPMHLQAMPIQGMQPIPIEMMPYPVAIPQAFVIGPDGVPVPYVPSAGYPIGVPTPAEKDV